MRTTLPIALILLFLATSSRVAWALVTVSVVPSGGFGITPGVAVVDQAIADIDITADESYEVTLKDDTGGNLVNGVNNLPYTVKYDGGSEVSLSTTPLSVETGLSAGAPARSLTIFIAAGASVGLPAGDYSATITVEILAN